MQQPRILDVNLNRLTESLKFIEDYVRFSLNHKKALRQVRDLRRYFLTMKKALPLTELVTFRKSHEDLGRGPLFDRTERKTTTELVIANLCRAKESLRVIEEVMKMNDMALSRHAKEMRFRIYDIEKLVLGLQRRKFNPRLCVIFDERYLDKINIVKTVRILEEGGATMIQLRVKSLPDREFFKRAMELKRHISRPDIKLLINDRPDIAMLSGADGVHVGQTDLPVREVRRMLGESFIIGASVHDLKQARQAVEEGADYLGVGAIYATKTKNDAVVCGIEKLRFLCRRVDIPVIGIGGINNVNYETVLRAGAAGIAVSSFVFEGKLNNNIRTLTAVKK